MSYHRILRKVFVVLLCSVSASEAQQAPVQRSQNPSPMVERTRAHGRIMPALYPGIRDSVVGVLPRTVDIYLPARHAGLQRLDVVLNFHSAPYITHHAAESTGLAFAGVTISLGGGSSAYGDPFADASVFPRLLEAVASALQRRGIAAERGRVVLAGFSAGYGAVRRILSQPENRALVDAALLLDGIHASYVPERTVLAEGGIIDSSNVATFLSFAREASDPASARRFLITHSEVFPGTFASTTECTDWIMERLGLRRTAVLRWGPLGMQQTSEVNAGNFSILGFAGNSGVDHGDHLHAFGHFLSVLLR